MEQFTPPPMYAQSPQAAPMAGHSGQVSVPVLPQEASMSLFKRGRFWAALGGLVIATGGSGAAGYAMGHSAAKAEDAAAASAAAAAASSAADARLSNAYEACTGQDAEDTVELADNGNSIIIDTRSEYTSVAGMACVLNELETPESVLSSIGHTTAMMGSQSAENDGLNYSWSYHPDNGVNLVITNQS